MACECCDHTNYGSGSNLYFLQELNKKVHSIKCDLGESSSTDLTTIESLLDTINNNLITVLSELQLRKYDYEVVCSSVDSRLLLLKVDYINGNQVLTELNGTVVVDGSTPINCDNPSLESDAVDICVLGLNWNQWIIKSNGIPTGAIYYTDELGELQPAPASFQKGKCISCDSNISFATGDDLSTLSESNNFLITKPSCCEITVETSIGTFILRDGVSSYSTTDFNCLVTVDNITVNSGDCLPIDIHIIGNRK